VARALPTVDVKDFARHEAGPFEVEDGLDNGGELAETANRVQGSELSICLDGMHRRLDGAGCDRVHPDTALRILDRERFGRGIQTALRQRREYDGTLAIVWSARLVVICTTWPLPCFSISATASCVM
jgi:hypothetical protein